MKPLFECHRILVHDSSNRGHIKIKISETLGIYLIYMYMALHCQYDHPVTTIKFLWLDGGGIIGVLLYIFLIFIIFIIVLSPPCAQHYLLYKKDGDLTMWGSRIRDRQVLYLNKIIHLKIKS